MLKKLERIDFIFIYDKILKSIMKGEIYERKNI